MVEILVLSENSWLMRETNELFRKPAQPNQPAVHEIEN